MPCLSRHLFPLVLLSSSSHSPACVVAPVAFCHKLGGKIFTAGIICACGSSEHRGAGSCPWAPQVPRAAAGRGTAGIQRGEMVAAGCCFKHRHPCEIPSATLKSCCLGSSKAVSPRSLALAFTLAFCLGALGYGDGGTAGARLRLCLCLQTHVRCNMVWKPRSVTQRQRSGFEKREVGVS